MCSIAKSTMVCFYWVFILQPVWCPRMLGWFINGTILPENHHTTGWWDWPWILATFWDIWSLKQPELMPFGHKKFWIKKACHLVATHHPPSYTHIDVFVVLSTLWNKLSKMVDNLTNYLLWSWFNDRPLMTVDWWTNVHKRLYVFLRYNEFAKLYF